MRVTSGTWLHAQLTLMVAACFSAGCGGSTSKADAETAGASPAAGGRDSVPQGGNVAQAGKAAHGGVGQGGTTAQGGQVAVGGATSGAPGLTCADTRPKLTDGWHTEPALDYVALIWRSQDVPMTQEESGVLCAGASSATDCQTAYAALVPASSWERGVPLSFQEYFSYSRGDDVGTIGTAAELRQVLGDIDTANEAAVWLYVNNRAVRCDALEELPDGYLGHVQVQLSDCPITYQATDVKLAPDGTLTETKVGEVMETNTCAGRRPDGLQLASNRRRGSALGQCFAHMAELELASIAAFAALERQLAAHGAPEQLSQRCRSACADEVRHARAVAALARRFGAQPQAVCVVPPSLPSLSQLALENVREGCVRELYGAAVATWQSAHAQDPQIRAVFATIARDEAAHAALALDLAAWLDQHLSEAERAEVEAERQRALVQLRAELLVAPDTEAGAVAGLPGAAQAAALLASLTELVSADAPQPLLS